MTDDSGAGTGVESGLRHISGFDASFFHMETRSLPMNIGGVGIYAPSARPQGKVGFDEVLREARRLAARTPAYRQRLRWPPLGLDQPYWEDDPLFDAANHVFRVTLSPPRNRRRLDQEILRIQAQPIDRARPLWEWWFIDGLDAVEGTPAESFALVFKVHHALFDGLSAWRWIKSAHDAQRAREERRGSEARAREQPAPFGGRLGLAQHLSRRAAARPGQIAETLRNATRLLVASTGPDISRSPAGAGRTPRTRFDRVPSPHRVRARIVAPLGEIKAIRALHREATVGDVLLAIVGGGLRRYLLHHGQLPGASLIVGLPISIRQESTREGGNELTCCTAPLCTEAADPRARLATIARWTAEKKKFVTALPTRSLIEILDHVPEGVTALALAAARSLQSVKLLKLPFNTVVTYLPTSRTRLHFLQSQMVEFSGLSPLWAGLTLLHTATRYTDLVTITFVADPVVLPDVDFYCDCLEASKRELLNVARSAASAPG